MTASTRELLGRVLVAVLAIAGYLIGARRRHASAGAPSRLGCALAPALAAAPSVAVVTRAVHAHAGHRWEPPAGRHQQAELAVRIVTGVLIEESLWRGPVALAPARWRPALGALSATGFVLGHARRDGRAAVTVLLPSALGWTAAAAVHRRLRWPVLAHLGYNIAASLLRASADIGTPSHGSVSARAAATEPA